MSPQLYVVKAMCAALWEEIYFVGDGTVMVSSVMARRPIETFLIASTFQQAQLLPPSLKFLVDSITRVLW
jgi:hypothetical protein